MAESVDVGEDAVVVEVKEGAIKGDVHDCLFTEGVPTDRFFSSADVGAGEEVHDVAWLTTPHGPVQGWFSRAGGYPRS